MHVSAYIENSSDFCIPPKKISNQNSKSMFSFGNALVDISLNINSL